MDSSPAPRLARCHVLSGFALKRIAIVSMVLDHVNSIVIRRMLDPYIENGTLYIGPDAPKLITVLLSLRPLLSALGSIAFPIFCFLAVEGFCHTRDVKRYAARLLLFAVLSEIPYDLAHYSMWMNFKLQNVLFTLFCGVVTLFLLQWISQRFAANRKVLILYSALAVLSGMGLAFLIRGEYVFLGVLSMTLMYLLRKRPVLAATLGTAPLAVASLYDLAAAPLLILYSGSRGRGSGAFFYWFYPTHFLVLYFIARLILRV